MGSPIIIDTKRDGFHLTSAANGVNFDLDTNGVPELIAWTEADSDDGWLAMDRNGNGKIDNGSELFGNYTPAHNGSTDPFDTTDNGFDALRFLQGGTYGSSVSDHQIDSRDAAFSRLLLWRDKNHNGISEADELTPVVKAGIASISTDFKEKKRVDGQGNEFRQKGSLLWSDGATEPIFDVYLKHQ
jgi:hypothetical protein